MSWPCFNRVTGHHFQSVVTPLALHAHSAQTGERERERGREIQGVLGKREKSASSIRQVKGTRESLDKSLFQFAKPSLTISLVFGLFCQTWSWLIWIVQFRIIRVHTIWRSSQQTLTFSWDSSYLRGGLSRLQSRLHIKSPHVRNVTGLSTSLYLIVLSIPFTL